MYKFEMTYTEPDGTTHPTQEHTLRSKNHLDKIVAPGLSNYAKIRLKRHGSVHIEMTQGTEVDFKLTELKIDPK